MSRQIASRQIKSRQIQVNVTGDQCAEGGEQRMAEGVGRCAAAKDLRGELLAHSEASTRQQQ
jgi:hypothetical protein